MGCPHLEPVRLEVPADVVNLGGRRGPGAQLLAQGLLGLGPLGAGGLALLLTLKVALLATVMALILGTLAAAAVYRYDFFGKETISFMLVLPLALPGIVTGIAIRSAIRIHSRLSPCEMGNSLSNDSHTRGSNVRFSVENAALIRSTHACSSPMR